MISIITATYNSAETISSLVESLNKQTDQQFEWVVVDGASDDNTVDLINKNANFRPLIISEPDNGIYDAINKGIQAASSDYYICVGGDDVFYPDAIETINKGLASKHDVYTYAVYYGEKLVQKSNKPLWLVLYRKYTAAHSLATVFRKALHEQYGYYSTQYRIASDLEFMLKVFPARNNAILYADKALGCFSTEGVSSIQIKLSLDEAYIITTSLGYNRLLQRLVYWYRLLKNTLL